MAVSYKQTEQKTVDDNIDNNINESFVYNLSLKDYILRILILGSRENKYSQKKISLSPEDKIYILSQIQAGHGKEILDIVTDVYVTSRAPKLDISLNILAILCRTNTDAVLKAQSLQVLEKIRTISHLYSWKNFHANVVNPTTGEKTKGFGRAVKRSLNSWVLEYRDKAIDLAYQVTKYQAREGWSFKNMLQCTHLSTKTGDDRVFAEPKEDSKKYAVTHKKKKQTQNKNNVPPTDIDLVLRYTVNGFDAMDDFAKKWHLQTPTYEYLKAVNEAKHSVAEDQDKLVELIYTHKLTREQVPTWGLANTEVLSALLVNKKKTRVSMPLTALLRNLGNLTAHRVLNDATTLQLVMKHLVHPDTIKFSKIHPVTVLTALFTYRNGHGNHGHNSWTPKQHLVNTLEEMFYLSFKNVEPTGKRICFLIDCSGSMGSQSLCEGVTCAESAALLAMIFARSETKSETSPEHSFYLFTCNSRSGYDHRNDTGLTDVTDVIDATAKLENVLRTCQRSDWGMTDISMGILEALKYKRKYDAFVVITDNDVNSGIKPSEAMKQYRDGMKLPNAKLAVVATLSSDITIADPHDKNMMDMCGFDSHGPKILQDFIRD